MRRKWDQALGARLIDKRKLLPKGEGPEVRGEVDGIEISLNFSGVRHHATNKHGVLKKALL